MTVTTVNDGNTELKSKVSGHIKGEIVVNYYENNA